MTPRDPDDPRGAAEETQGIPDPDPARLRRSKVSPHLWAAQFDWARRRRDGDGPTQAPIVRILIELIRQDPAVLDRMRLPHDHLYGTTYASVIALDRLDELVDEADIRRVHHEQPSQPSLDDSIPEIRASTVRNATFPFAGTDKFTGAGVVVGIIDSGINILHPVFRRPDDQTRSRILAILDQTVTPPKKFTRAQIEAAIATGTELIQPGRVVGGVRVESSRDDHKHGTHVAGIAAGNGKKAGNCSGEFKYVGVAPDADLVIVKYDFGGPATMKEALQFVTAEAASANPLSPPPVVINMSLGHSIGPHDGTDPMDQLMDNFLIARALIPPAVVLVAAAGNDGQEGFHGAGTVPGAGAGGVKRLRFNVNAQRHGTGQFSTFIDIRYNNATGMSCRLIPPGNNTSGGTTICLPGASTTFTETDRNSSCAIFEHTVSGVGIPRRILITVTTAIGADAKNKPGDWKIELTNTDAAAIDYHAWITGDQWERLLDDVTRSHTIGSPGSATRIISVGNYVSSGKDKGKLSESSSRGPRVDGLMKPELSAPGEDICAAKRDLHTGCCCDCCCDSYIDMSGTSMAAPHVTGAVALMLQRNPALTHDEVKQVLMRAATARLDAFTGPAPGNEFGSGKLDVLAALNDPLVRGPGTVITASSAAPAMARRSAAVAVAEQWPTAPQLQEGTPLWRLLNTPEGERTYQLARAHWDEVRGLVNTNRRIATAWHRNGGPMLLHHATRTSLLPHVPLPEAYDGVELAIRAARLVSAFEPYASRELIAAMHATLPLVKALQGKTLLEITERFEARAELQHA